ncbi:hypothetical protein MTR_7g034205 [Medicago truncatula]|uniref:Uncharacterized protein n=1 Tax=Medicago truncatula TaxID=3880 RepID=G7ZV23_MEDTR|nr:hypothetical protein MTR_7g034205 [Medicago truncatula]
MIYFFFLISKERRQTSRGIIDIPTRLASRETPILCRHALKNLLKKGKKINTKGEGTRPKPSKNKKRRK